MKIVISFRVLFLVLLFSTVIISIASCTGSEKKPLNFRSSLVDEPLQATLSLAEAPKLGEVTEVVLAVHVYSLFNIDPSILSDVQAWVEFTWANIYGSYSEAKYAVDVPLDEVLVNGDLAWEGSIELKETVELRGTIRLPREGVWAITGYFTGNGWQKPVMVEMRVAVTKDAAAVIGTREFYKGPLAYLGKFGYGQGHKPMPYEAVPVKLEFDISKAPLVGEEAVITCYIHSFLDLADFSNQITFWKRTVGNKKRLVSEDNLLVDGVLKWKGNLSKDVPSQFSATIKFPEEGDWWIHVQADYPINDLPGFAANMRIHISRDLSSFGWEDWP